MQLLQFHLCNCVYLRCSRCSRDDDGRHVRHGEEALQRTSIGRHKDHSVGGRCLRERVVVNKTSVLVTQVICVHLNGSLTGLGRGA